jgi:hypothetical protein
MNDSVFAKYLGRSDEAPDPNDNEGLDDLGCFGFLRGVRDRAIMLELRQRNGQVSALGYAWLERAEFDPSDGITLHFSGKTVKIVGRNLNGEVRPNVRLFAGIVRHRVPWIQEADEASILEAKKGAPVIEHLEVKT